MARSCIWRFFLARALSRAFFFFSASSAAASMSGRTDDAVERAVPGRDSPKLPRVPGRDASLSVWAAASSSCLAFSASSFRSWLAS